MPRPDQFEDVDYARPRGSMADLTQPGTLTPPMRPDEYARWYAQRVPGTTAPPPPPAPAPTTPTPAATEPERTAGTGFGGYEYGGFNFEQPEENRMLGRSPKYTLAEATRRAGEAGAGDLWKTKEGAEQFAEQYIRPLFEANGIQVLNIRGDSIQVKDQYGTYWVDWVQNASGPNPKIAWQPQTSSTGFTQTRFSQTPFQASALTTTGTTPAAASATEALHNLPGINAEAYRRLSSQPGSLPAAIESLRLAARQYLGRELGTDADIARDHLGGGRLTAQPHVQAAIETIRQSPEAQAYRQRTTAGAATPPPVASMFDLTQTPLP
jgi:hypothetical protein